MGTAQKATLIFLVRIMKKELVTDVNVIFSGLISGNERILQIFSDYNIYTPDFALTEIQKYQELIASKTKLAPEKLKAYTLSLFKQIIVVPNLIISNQSYFKAFQLCKGIDEQRYSLLSPIYRIRNRFTYQR
jgi:predicted nucleic acid-binding protein